MRSPAIARNSFVAAIALAALTITIFYLLRYYGPISTIRKFHQDVLSSRAEGLGNTFTTTSDPRAIEGLADTVGRLARGGARFSLQNTIRKPGIVVAVVYYFDRQETIALPVLWVTVKERGRWRIDANQTIELSRRFGF